MSDKLELKTWGEGWFCAMCCNGDRCDDPSHFDRKNCPNCKGSGIALWNMHEKARSHKALTAELARVKTELDAALKRLNTITKSAYMAGDGWRIGAAFPPVGPHKLSGLSKADFYAAVDAAIAAREG